jgi:hypothetical protein
MGEMKIDDVINSAQTPGSVRVKKNGCLLGSRKMI